MKLGIKKWFMTVGLSLMAVAAVACSGVTASPTSTDGTAATATPVATNHNVSNPAATATATSGSMINIGDLTAAQIVQAEEQHMESVYQATLPSVVRIITTVGATGGGEGSGWVWSADGYIVTNYHVVENARTISVYFADGHEYDASVVGTDTNGDIAVIKIDANNLTPAQVGNSSSLHVGQTTIAIGNPFGQDFTMTTGIVSAVGRAIDSGFTQFAIPSVIQTDAAINPGNSGGPLLDSSGNVIGMNTQIRSQSGQNSGVGFAVPVDLVKRVVPSLIENGKHDYAYLGITMVTLENRIRQNLDVPSDLRGAYVTTVYNDTPADAAGLMADSGSNVTYNYDGDVIVSVDGTATPTTEDLIAYLAIYTSPGDKVDLQLYRGGKLMTVSVTLGSRDNVSS